MKGLSIVIILFSFIACNSHGAFALQILSPKEGQVVYQGDRLTVIVQPAPGEDWKEVLIEGVPMNYNLITNEYKAEVEIPRDESIGIISFSVAGYDRNGKELLLKRTLFVKLPPNVVLQGIMAGSKVVSGSTLVLLEKLPAGSSATDIETYEKSELSVHGQYSDGVNRILTSSASGTTYASSDEKVVTVDKEGKVVAQGIGKAKITVRNGNFSANVDVLVKPYKK